MFLLNYLHQIFHLKLSGTAETSEQVEDNEANNEGVCIMTFVIHL